MNSKTIIEREDFNNFTVTIAKEESHTRYYITATSPSLTPQKQACLQSPSLSGINESLKDIFEYLKQKKAEIAYQFIFANFAHYDKTIKYINEEVNPTSGINWPITWLEGDCCNDNCFTGTQLCAISGIDLTPIYLENKIVGKYYETNDAKYCYLGNIHSNNSNQSNAEQAKDAYIMIKDILTRFDMKFTDITRMWNYLSDLLTWYGDFNKMRTKFFTNEGLFKTNFTPSATGIGVANIAGMSYVGNLLAIKPKNSNITIKEVESPLQCSAQDYRSSFSRLAKVEGNGLRQLYISGTASIEPMGKTVNLNDVKGQIELTMQVVSAMLTSQEMDWSNVSDSIAYFTKLEDIDIFYNFLKTNGYPNFPVTISHANICRDNLLFEIEVDAISKM